MKGAVPAGGSRLLFFKGAGAERCFATVRGSTSRPATAATASSVFAGRSTSRWAGPGAATAAGAATSCSWWTRAQHPDRLQVPKALQGGAGRARRRQGDARPQGRGPGGQGAAGHRGQGRRHRRGTLRPGGAGPDGRSWPGAAAAAGATCASPRPTNKCPTFYEKGEPGEERWLLLELKVVADVGLVGFPNAGKSTFLSAVSAARPKIANYPFTTLEPEPGRGRRGRRRAFVIADIPGLIEGAHAGGGPGPRVPAPRGADEGADPRGGRVGAGRAGPGGRLPYDQRRAASLQPGLPDRPQLVAANKMDLAEARANLPRLREALEAAGFRVFPISGRIRRRGGRAGLRRVGAAARRAAA